MAINRDHGLQFIVTGASGNVGRHLIPILASKGARVWAVGRNVSVLRTIFSGVSGVRCIDYQELAAKKECDTLVHLAVRNNDRPGTFEEFAAVNVEFAQWIAREFERMGGRRFINLSSILALDESNSSPYAASKDQGNVELARLLGDRLNTVHIGYFYSERYFGEKLKALTRTGLLGRLIFSFLKLMKPTTSASSLAAYLLNEEEDLVPSSILTDELTINPLYRAAIRICDILVGASILIGLFPILVGLWIWVRCDSPGPGIFAQRRVGEKETLFTLYKFRTMKTNTQSVGTHEIGEASVTTPGKFLRRTKLDELPQAINLLRGDMTLVGPRPCLPVQIELIEARRARGVFAIKPGITGYAQVRGIDMSRPDALAHSDSIYMRVQSFALNAKILISTLLGRGAGDRVRPE